MKKLMTYTATLIIIIIFNNNYTTYGQVSGNSKSVPLLRLKGALTKSGSPADEAVIYFYAGATVNYDYEFDGKKLLNTDPKLPNIYTITPEHDSLVINALPDTIKEIIVPLSFDVAKEDDYNIWASEMSNFNDNMQIFIEDTKENITQNLNTTPQYQCHVTPSDKNRFLIHFTTINTITGVNNVAKASDIFNFYTSGNVLYLTYNSDKNSNAKLNIYDMNGRKVMNTIEIKGGSHQYNLDNLSYGFYLISIEKPYRIVAKKIHLG